jgi:hypothetical protein
MQISESCYEIVFDKDTHTLEQVKTMRTGLRR